MSSVSPDPVALYLDKRPAFMREGPLLGAAFFYFSPVNVIPKLWLGKLSVVEIGHTIGLLDPLGGVRLLPCGGHSDYYRALCFCIERYGNVMPVPKWAADPFRATYKVSVLQHEYQIMTEAVRSHAGSRLKRVRTDLNRTFDTHSLEQLSADNAVDYLALNRDWYREASERMFRTYDKTSIDALLNRHVEVVDLAPDVRFIGLRSGEGALDAFGVSAHLADNVWSPYTSRYRRTVRGVNSRAFVEMACSHNDVLANDGTADTKGIRDSKDRFPNFKLTSYKVVR